MKLETISSKTVLIGLLTIALAMTSAGMAVAGISKTGSDDYCNLCHTGGNATDGTTSQTCVECHSSSESSTIYELVEPLGETVKVPVIYYTGSEEPSAYLAGGNFYWVAQGDDTKGHNVGGISSQDPNFPYAPGGPNWTSCYLTDKEGVVLNCHATIGSCRSCHVPRHHAPDKIDQTQYALVDETGGYYRFLGQIQDTLAAGYNHTDTGRVRGGEDPYWEQNPSSTSHNEYPGQASRPSYPGVITGP